LSNVDEARPLFTRQLLLKAGGAYLLAVAGWYFLDLGPLWGPLLLVTAAIILGRVEHRINRKLFVGLILIFLAAIILYVRYIEENKPPEITVSDTVASGSVILGDQIETSYCMGYFDGLSESITVDEKDYGEAMEGCQSGITFEEFAQLKKKLRGN
jgi:hypothetical protein